MLVLENAREGFAQAHDSFSDHTEEVNFYHTLSRMIPDRIDVENLILIMDILLRQEAKKGTRTETFITLVPRYVRQISSPEFAHEFRKNYFSQIVGIDWEEPEEGKYQCVEVEPNVIDISSKDKYEVFAALYNACLPVGLGLGDYNPMPWNKTMAEFGFKHFGKEADGRVHFKWVAGRPMSISFQDNLVYVGSYNYENETGLAQRVIRTVPDSIQKEQSHEKVKN